MKIAVLSDVHSNSHALEAVLEDCWGEVDGYWFLGDLVGYGPDPAPALRWMQNHVLRENWVMGNHDVMLSGELSEAESAEVNQTPLQAIDLNRKKLAPDTEIDLFWRAKFRREERQQPRIVSADGVDYVLVHGCQQVPLFRYVYPWHIEFHLPDELALLAAQSRQQERPRVQFFGHTHIPTLVLARPGNPQDELEVDTIKVVPQKTYRLETELAMVNPGSVGQPRDLDRRAAYAILDIGARTVTFRRVAYDWQKVYQELIRQGFPGSLAERLFDARCPEDETPADWRTHFERAREIE